MNQGIRMRSPCFQSARHVLKGPCPSALAVGALRTMPSPPRPAPPPALLPPGHPRTAFWEPGNPPLWGLSTTTHCEGPGPAAGGSCVHPGLRATVRRAAASRGVWALPTWTCRRVLLAFHWRHIAGDTMGAGSLYQGLAGIPRCHGCGLRL